MSIQELTRPDLPLRAKVGIIDSDVHPSMNPASPGVIAHLPQRWREYMADVGLRAGMPGGDRPRHREFASRWDAVPPAGGAPGNDPAFARKQLLDRYDVSAAVLNDIGGFQVSGGLRIPAEFSAAFCTALNNHRAETWFEDDPRWYGSISLPYEVPDLAVKEIVRCKEEMGAWNDRWVQVMFAPDNERPAGYRKYWPIFEVCQHYDIPIGFHVLTGRRITPSGPANFYFEEHCDFAALNFPVVSSLVFEGVFDRFPNLKIAMVELAWSWVVPLAWRMDHAYRIMNKEVKLERLPSEYIRDHFWFTTQPMEEPDEPAWFDDVLGLFEASGMADKIMYSSDYPHWDFDAPDAFPLSVQRQPERMARILGENASALYGLELIPGTGFDLPR
jgi:uncharacterized protein